MLEISHLCNKMLWSAEQLTSQKSAQIFRECTKCTFAEYLSYFSVSNVRDSRFASPLLSQFIPLGLAFHLVRFPAIRVLLAIFHCCMP
jgi:hypothetical protein